MPDDNLTKKLNFELPVQQINTGHRQSRLLTVILILLLLGVSANIFISLRAKALTAAGQKKNTLNTDLKKKLALKLEKRGLYTSSAIAWKEYITEAGLGDKDTALIWYRIGKLYQDNNAYEQALDSYYRSESFSSMDSIASEIAIRIQECLESMGKFSAMRHELSDRVTLKPSGNTAAITDPVVAEIGNQKITASEIDQRMENNIEHQISLMAPYLPEEDRNKQKGALLKQFATPANRMMFLNQYVAEEILYRKAREINLAKNPKIRNLINDQERRLLAKMALEKQYENRIKITLSDLRTYYDANKEAYKKEDKQQPFEDVKNDVYKTLRSQKEQEIQQELLTQLKEQYDVVIHQSALKNVEEKKDAETPTKAKAPLN
ncbi:MAG: hypothetical protein J7K96_14100 [Desulfobacteraceae bacterium]|nr:hypothetical protein [Desulfobacteraceae bacterium]